ncbi:MAG TPA: energy transducer TonB [Planctomycetota bacterium]|jgi:protein TonB|nr:energy transducer TonB [Planctomycetota bacterium]
MGRFLGILCAVGMHLGVILFGGLLFHRDPEDKGTLQQVELLREDDAATEKEKREEPAAEEKAEMETETEQAPDAAEILRSLERSPAVDAPALEAASLGAIEQALSGQAGGGFADALTFASGGRIGGMGKAGAPDERFEGAFSLAEIDQKPQPIFQAAPPYPSEMRGKKLEGLVTVLFVVDSCGKVADPRVDKSTHPAFERPALDAVRQWKFEPALKAGHRVSCRMRVPIRFQPS